MAKAKKAKVFDGYEWLSGFASSDDSRPVLTQILVTERDGQRVAVACDGFQMGILPVDDSVPLGQMPAKNMAALNDNVTFPDYEAVAYGKQDVVMRVNTTKLYAAVKTANALGARGTEPRDRSVFIYGTSAGTLQVLAVSAEYGEVMRTATCEQVAGNGPSLEFCVYPKSLLHVLQGWKDTYTLVGYSYKHHRITITPDRAGSKPHCIVMAQSSGERGMENWAEKHDAIENLLFVKPQRDTWVPVARAGAPVDEWAVVDIPVAAQPMLWNTGIPKSGGMADVSLAIHDFQVPPELDAIFVALRNKLTADGWTAVRRQAVGRWVFKGEVVNKKPPKYLKAGKVYLSAQDRELEPTEDNDAYRLAIRLAAYAIGQRATHRQRTSVSGGWLE